MTLSIWERLSRHRAATSERTIADLFANDPRRFEDFSLGLDDLLFDFSKTAIDRRALELLLELAATSDLDGRRAAMFQGDKINTTEDRAVLHTALRASPDKPVKIDGNDVMPGVTAMLDAMTKFADAVRTGVATAPGGERFTDVINIGIGGSDLGPMMVTQALAPYHDGPALHFVSNVDAAHLADTIQRLDPRSTLIIIASKTFTTLETMTNAQSARRWLAATVGEDATAGHFVAISSTMDRARAFGIAADRVFGFEDWVGGRYSLWGPIGLPIMLGVGPKWFRALLAGARAMDEHFRSTPFEKNMPVLLALVGIWHRNVCSYGSRAILPYAQRLARFTAYLQQLDMESNGKRVAIDGAPLSRASGPVIWGEPGTNGQHAFYQFLHQGTDVVPCEFLVAANGTEPELGEHQILLIASCLAQSEALMLGLSLQDAHRQCIAEGITDPDGLAPHRVFPGNRPSTTLIYDRLDPHTLGRLIALYEHRVFAEGVIWGLNSFDQWGVELGKTLTTKTKALIEANTVSPDKDASTNGLIAAIAGLRAHVQP